jgi:hypothetical protein
VDFPGGMASQAQYAFHTHGETPYPGLSGDDNDDDKADDHHFHTFCSPPPDLLLTLPLRHTDRDTRMRRAGGPSQGEIILGGGDLGASPPRASHAWSPPRSQSFPYAPTPSTRVSWNDEAEVEEEGGDGDDVDDWGGGDDDEEDDNDGNDDDDDDDDDVVLCQLRESVDGSEEVDHVIQLLEEEIMDLNTRSGPYSRPNEWSGVIISDVKVSCQ